MKHRVRMVIEFEIDTEPTPNLPDIPVEDILDKVRIWEHDMIDGFELTRKPVAGFDEDQEYFMYNPKIISQEIIGEADEDL